MLKFIVVLAMTNAVLGAQEASPPTIIQLELPRDARLDAELHRIRVPENRQRKDSREIELAVVRVRSVVDKPGPPVFVLAGGPGGASVGLLKSIVASAGTDLLRDLGGDLVAIDQRGVGLSKPNLQSRTRYGFTVEAPGDRAQMLTRIKDVCRGEAKRWREQGVDLDGYTTNESADDIDAVRRRLGYEKIVLWGGSYGSHLAFATLRRHGDHVDRAVLRGIEGPDHTIKLPSYAQTGLERIAKLVAADEELGPLIPDLVDLTRKVLDSLEGEPVFVTVGGRRIGISKFDVQRWIAGQIGRARTMRPVPATIYAMSKGDFSAVANQLMMQRYSSTVRSAMAMMMDSASGISKQRAKLIEAQKKTCLLGDSVNFPFPDVAEAWGSPDAGDEFRATLHSDVPMLFISGDLDSRTPIANAREMMKHLPNAHLIVVENAGHEASIRQHEKLRRAFADFLSRRPVSLERVRLDPPRWHSISRKHR